MLLVELESYNRQTTGYEFVSVAINGQNFLPSLDGEDGCILNPDACAKFKYYTQTVASIWPPAGPALGTTDVRVSGEFSPGYDGVPTSAQCLYTPPTGAADAQTSVLKALEPLVVECEAPLLPEANNNTAVDQRMGVALNGAYVADDSADYVAIRNVCPANVVGNYQQFGQYRHAVHSVEPTGGPVGGGTTVTIRGEGFTPITTPSLDPPMLSASVRCLWSCTPRDAAFFSQRVCSERGVAAAPLLTRPVSVTNDEIICDTPPRASAGLASLALALNVYDAVGATCDDKLHNGDEAGVDCGGASCAPCAPSCYDGVQNGEETGVDCGGGHATADGYTHCPYCIPACDAPGADGQDCLLPALSRVEPASAPSGHATLLTVHGEGFRKAGELITYTKQVLGRDVEFTHNALPRCTFSSHGNRYETPATVHNSSFITCRAPLGNLVGCYTLLVSLDVCDFHADVLASCPASKQEGLAYSYVPTTQYAGYTSDAYAYEGDFIHSGLQFKFYDHPAPTFAGRALWGASRLVDVVPKAGFDLGARAVVNIGAAVIKVEGGGPLLGGTELTISLADLVKSNAELRRQLRRHTQLRHAVVHGRHARRRRRRLDHETGHDGASPFLALEALDASLAANLSRCAFGDPPYTAPLNLTADTIVCRAPPKAEAGVVPIRVSLNGQQFFETGLDFQYYAHPTLSSIYPAGGVTVGATPVTLYGEGFRRFRPAKRVQRCSWGRAGSGARHDARACSPTQ